METQIFFHVDSKVELRDGVMQTCKHTCIVLEMGFHEFEQVLSALNT